MPEELQSSLSTLIWLAVILAINLNVFILSKTYGWFSDRTVTLKGEVKTAASDNIYTEMAAGKHTEAAKLNLEAQKIALKTAETNERIEQSRSARAHNGQTGSS
jgi:hypothetical protein